MIWHPVRRAWTRPSLVGLAILVVAGCAQRLPPAPSPEAPAEMSNLGFILPLAGVVTSTYGPRRLRGVARLHKGIDLATPERRAPVFAAADGVVSYVGSSSSYGHWIEIAHRSGLSTRYAHLSDTEVSKGMEVKRGAPIGRTGSTGRATREHLHFEVRRDGAPLDPLIYLPSVRIVGDRGRIREAPPPPPTEVVPRAEIESSERRSP